MSETYWRRCSSCKREIPFGAVYWTCNVSTCNRKMSTFVFCKVTCWEMHVPTMRHRESWAEEQRAPTAEAWARTKASPATIRRPAGASASGPTTPRAGASSSRNASGVADGPPPLELAANAPTEILIVASKLKAYIRARSGMNTSDSVMETLSNQVRELCDDAMERAHEAERRTVMDRDF